MVDKAVVWHHRLVLHNESPNHPRQRLKHFRLKFAKIWLVGFPHVKREERNPWSSLSTDLSKGIAQSISHAMKKGNEWKGGSQFVQQIKERRKQVITVQTVMLACAQHLAFDFSIKPIKWWQRYWQSVVDSEYGPKIDDQISVELSEKKGKTKRPPLFFTFFYFSSVIQDHHGKKKIIDQYMCILCNFGIKVILRYYLYETTKNTRDLLRFSLLLFVDSKSRKWIKV